MMGLINTISVIFVILGVIMNKSNWTGRTSRTLNEAFGPYHSKNYKLPRERKERPILTTLTGLGLAAVWFAAFWILGA